jgi:hypothetical protein
MGYAPAVQSLSQVAWPGALGRDSSDSESTGGRPRSFTPAGIQTPEEALAYIQLLSKAGRTDELVGLLRHSPVFREAWQSLQQFAAASDVGGPPAATIPAPDASGQPSPLPQAAPTTQLSSQAPALPRETATPGNSPETPAVETYPVLASKPSHPMADLLQAYTSQQRHYLEGRDPQSRISLRV